MSSLHIINTGVPGVLFCHTFIMHARLTLCAGSYTSNAHALPLQTGTGSTFPLLSPLHLRLGGYSLKAEVINYHIQGDNL